MELKIRFVFDGKGGKVDSYEQSVGQQVGAFADIVRQLVDEPSTDYAPEPLWRSALTAVGGFLLTLLALCFVGAVIGGLAYAARYGWELGQ